MENYQPNSRKKTALRNIFHSQRPQKEREPAFPEFEIPLPFFFVTIPVLPILYLLLLPSIFRTRNVTSFSLACATKRKKTIDGLTNKWGHGLWVELGVLCVCVWAWGAGSSSYMAEFNGFFLVFFLGDEKERGQIPMFVLVGAWNLVWQMRFYHSATALLAVRHQ